MRKFLFICSLLFCFVGAKVEASCYLDGIDQVIYNDQGVFIFVDGECIGADALQVSPEGIYLLEGGIWLSLDEILCYSCCYLWWECSFCGAYNHCDEYSCYWCGLH